MRYPRIGLTMVSLFVLAFVWTVSPVRAGRQGGEQAKKANGKLPPAVAKTLLENCPGAEIDKIDVEKEAGIVLYDIEFKAGKGEIEVARDGTVMDVATIIALKDIPELAAEAIRKAAAGAAVTQIERSEVRAEIRKEGDRATVVKLASLRYVYEAELAKGEQKGEIQVAPDGKVVEVEEAVVPGALPPVVLQALSKAYPGYEILKAEELVKGGQKHFELHIRVKGKKIEVSIDPSGKSIE
jgi:uncharacterized membrane protein YkoI